ncbi:MAG: efflux RND transporter periplasmic adaptor subunit, partial [Maritimibacter sp.]|nr:efflux RND transporter periplasmic adaptor subunit [Maritimibacter sp.]
KPDWAMNRRERDAAARAAKGLPPKKSRRWIVWLVIVAALAAGAAWFVASGRLAEMQTERAASAAEAAAEAEARAARAAIIQLAPYEVRRIEPATLKETLKITGSLAPVRQLQLTSEVSAQVTNVTARPGDEVFRGQTLVAFDSDTLQNQLDQAQATAQATRVQLDQAQSDYDRTESLVNRGLQAANTLEKARSALDQLTATLAAQETQVVSARRALDRANVTAPFDGVVSARNVEPGQVVAAGSPLMTLVDMSSLEVEATAPVSFAPELAKGQAVDLTVEGFGDRVFDGKVARLAPVAIEGSRMLPVFVSLDNPGGELRGGMFASGRIVLESRAGGLAIPAGALRQDADGPYVLVIADDKAERRAVGIGRSWDGGVLLEVESGLAAGDLVVIEPLPELAAGDSVTLLAE